MYTSSLDLGPEQEVDPSTLLTQEREAPVARIRQAAVDASSTITARAKPGRLRVVGGNGTITLHWDDPGDTNMKGYEVGGRQPSPYGGPGGLPSAAVRRPRATHRKA